MLTLFHHPVCPHSRFVRLALGEYGLQVRLVGERVWERREDFRLLKQNAAGTIPVLIAEGIPPAPGLRSSRNTLTRSTVAILAIVGSCHVPLNLRIEVRRLASWFNDKFFADVSGPVTRERYRQYMPLEAGGGSPDHAVLHEVRQMILPIILPTSASPLQARMAC